MFNNLKLKELIFRPTLLEIMNQFYKIYEISLTKFNLIGTPKVNEAKKNVVYMGKDIYNTYRST